MLPDSAAYPRDILLVEDSAADPRLVHEALRAAALPDRLHRVVNPEQALTFLRRDGPYGQAPRPDLIVLDLNLPRGGGRRVLSAVKSHEPWRTIPIVVLSTSRANDDVVACLQLHANCYVPKPIQVDEYFAVIQAIVSFWGRVVARPR